MTALDNGLRYIDAGRVDTAAGHLGHAPVLSRTNAPLGKLDGIVIDPSSRQVRYYVVKSPDWLSSRHYLLPLTPGRLDRDRQAVQLDVEPGDLGRFDEVDPDAFARFSDEDLLAALFHPARR